SGRRGGCQAIVGAGWPRAGGTAGGGGMSSIEQAAVPHLSPAIPILRIFDEAKAREFYCEFLGFTVGFEHRFEAGLPLYMEVQRDALRLHLSEHHGDATPGSTVFVPLRGLEALY